MRAFFLKRLMLCGLILAALNPIAYAAEKTASNIYLAIIVPIDSPKDSISKAELNLIYWRKKEYWAGGKRMHPVNLPSNNAIRLLFSNAVLGSAPTEQNDYWNGLYFQGISPPHVVNSNEAAIRFVQETSGAIGYVNACNTDQRVKTIAWITENGNLLNISPNMRCAP